MSTSGVVRNNSSIIRAFVQTQQNLQLKNNNHQLADAVLMEASKKRRQQVENRKTGKKPKKESSFQQNISKAEQFRNMDDHKIPLEDLYKRLETSKESGLTQTHATQLNAKMGDNVLSEKKTTPWYVKLAKEMTGFFSLMLWAGGILCFVAYSLDTTDPSNLYLGIVLIIIVMITGFFTYYQNESSEAVMAGFKNFIPPKANTLRDGQWKSMEATKLVPGDIVKVKMGDKIPADIRIVYSKEMKVNNSSLTGESDPLLRVVECTNKENPLETANLAFFGTLCEKGEAIGIVIRIGDSTVIGQIANLAASASTEETPLRKEINRFLAYVGFISVGLGIVFFCLGFVVGYKVLTNFIFAIGICVANVPEGLLAAVTCALTITAKKLARKKVLVKNLEAVETLGSTTCICSDKTGTLTQNIMTLQHLWYDGQLVFAENKQKKGPNFKYEYDSDSIGFKYLHECAAVCSEAFFNNAPPESAYEKLNHIHDPVKKEAEKKHIEEEYAKRLNSMLWLDRPTVGDASETGLIKFFQAIEDIKATRDRYHIKINDDGSESKIPFDSVNKFALYIVEYPTKDSEYCLFIKGAPERIWAMCDKAYNRGQMEEIDESWRKKYNDVNLVLAKEGERVLGFAKFHLPRAEYPKGFQFKCLNIQELNVPLKNLAFLGLISLMDPPRDAVPFSVKKCKAAGIKVIMVTGDQPITAAAIAKKCNIISDKTVADLIEEGMSADIAARKANAIVIHGDELAAAMREDEGLPEEERGRKLANWLHKPQIVFARTSPAQKLIIVQGCQKLGHVVAVTGDGVNDSPAIKKADIGIAMGITGSEVAKDAADMVLLTDDFSAIIVGVEEGRKIFDNFKKTIIYCLASNISEMMPFITFVIFQFPLPLSSVLVLCIDIGTDMLPCVSFVFEDGELDLMTRPPRQKWEHMVTSRLIVFSYLQNGAIESCCGMLAYFTAMNDWGMPFWSIFYTVQRKGFAHPEGDVFDETMANYGNSDIYCDSTSGSITSSSDTEWKAPDWLYLSEKQQDLRMYYLTCENGVVKQNWDWAGCRIPQLSGVSGRPICYSTEALKYAQSSFFYATVFGQITCAFLLKTRMMSIQYQGIKNFFLTFAIHFETAIMLLGAFCYPFNIALGTRDNVWYHMGLIGIPFSVFLMIHDEFRKFLIRNYPQPDPGKPNWFYRNSLW